MSDDELAGLLEEAKVRRSAFLKMFSDLVGDNLEQKQKSLFALRCHIMEGIATGDVEQLADAFAIADELYLLSIKTKGKNEQ
jgi:hypothetical protein